MAKIENSTEHKAEHLKDYVKIKALTLGAISTSISRELTLLEYIQTYSIDNRKDIEVDNIKYFSDDAQIIFLVADMEDIFAVQNILKVINILSNVKLIITVVANITKIGNDTWHMANNIKQKSDLLIVENQKDIHINMDNTVNQKIIRIIQGLYDLLHIEKSQWNFEEFFGQKSEIYIYLNYTLKEVDNMEISKYATHIWLNEFAVSELKSCIIFAK